MTIPSFKNPPLVEVAISLQFEPLKNMTTAKIGDFWNLLGKENYPHTEDKQIAFPMSLYKRRNNYTPDIMGMPRVWLLNDNKTELVQIQRDRIIFNWRRTKEHPDIKYKRYDYVLSKFKHILTCLIEIFGEDIGYDIYELSYFNSIPFEHFGGINNISECLKDFNFDRDSRFLNDVSTLNSSIEFKVENLNGVLTADISSVDDILNNQKPSLRLDVSAKGLYGEPFARDLDSMLEWYDIAHEHIVMSFDDLTETKMHERWGKNEK